MKVAVLAESSSFLSILRTFLELWGSFLSYGVSVNMIFTTCVILLTSHSSGVSASKICCKYSLLVVLSFILSGLAPKCLFLHDYFLYKYIKRLTSSTVLK